MEIRMIPCECESKCGILIPEFDKKGHRRRFVKGHHRRGKTNSPETRKKISENHADVSGENNPNYGKPLSDEQKQKISKNHADVSGEKHPMFGRKHSPKSRQLMSKNRKGKQTVSSKTRQLISDNTRGENNPNWRGGIAYEPYCSIWSPWLKEEIKERDNHQCQNPDCFGVGMKLCVHHIDYDKKNCSTNNLITLCNSCNSRANFNREYWTEFYKKLIGGVINGRS